jgi:hypothetical protein
VVCLEQLAEQLAVLEDRVPIVKKGNSLEAVAVAHSHDAEVRVTQGTPT